LRRKAATIASLLFLVALVVGALFGDRGILQLAAQRGRAAALRGEIEELHNENARLAGEIQALKSDALAIERIAREELGLARGGETVFVMRDGSATRLPAKEGR
jgi:cell division protein FtsB